MNTMPQRYPSFHHLLWPLVWLLVPGLVAAVLAIAASASADPGLAAIGGEGANDISGYLATNIHYDLDEGNPGLIHAVSLNLIGADGRTRPTTVSITLGAGQPASTCWPTDGDKWTCPVSFPVAEASALRVVAAG
jgi:hypothetical protein